MRKIVKTAAKIGQTIAAVVSWEARDSRCRPKSGTNVELTADMRIKAPEPKREMAGCFAKPGGLPRDPQSYILLAVLLPQRLVEAVFGKEPRVLDPRCGSLG